MDEQVDEDEEILSQRSGTVVEMMEEEKFTDNRSIQGDNEVEMGTGFYCNHCKVNHETATTFSGFSTECNHCS
jgi:hypothetical protein